MDAITRRRLSLWLPLVLATALALLWLFWPRAVAVDFAAAGRGPIEVTVSDEGETRVRDVFVVSAPVAGFMRRIVLKPGDEVVAGETLVACIEPGDPTFLDRRTEAEARAAVQAADAARKLALASVRRAEADLEFASSELRRYRGLAERGVVSANDLEAAELRERTASAALAEARSALQMRDSELSQAQARLLAPGMARRREAPGCEFVAVFSPVSGSVLRVPRESEGIVASGTPLVEVGDPADLEIVVPLLSSDAVRVQPGQPVRIEAWGGATELAGRVRRVEPFGFTKVSALGIEEQRVNVIIDFADPPERWQRLGHGYRVEPRIILASSQDALKVPRAALFREGRDWAVFVNDSGRATVRVVELGLENGLEAEIRAGLAEGEQIVLQPGERVSAGTRLKARG